MGSEKILNKPIYIDSYYIEDEKQVNTNKKIETLDLENCGKYAVIKINSHLMFDQIKKKIKIKKTRTKIDFLGDEKYDPNKKVYILMNCGYNIINSRNFINQVDDIQFIVYSEDKCIFKKMTKLIKNKEIYLLFNDYDNTQNNNFDKFIDIVSKNNKFKSPNVSQLINKLKRKHKIVKLNAQKNK